MESFIVKPNGQKPLQAIEQSQKVAIPGWPCVLASHDLTGASYLNARPSVWPTVHLHQAVRTIPGATEKPAWPMIFEAAAETAQSRSVERCGDALAGNR
jgi:hypothetical protein